MRPLSRRAYVHEAEHHHASPSAIEVRGAGARGIAAAADVLVGRPVMRRPARRATRRPRAMRDQVVALRLDLARRLRRVHLVVAVADEPFHELAHRGVEVKDVGKRALHAIAFSRT